MPNNKKHFIDIINGIRRHTPELNLEPCRRLLAGVNDIRLEHFTDHDLKAMADNLKRSAREGASADGLLIQAYALVREASHRVLKMRPFDVQVLAGIAMHYGALVEMQTGEGKTLAAVSPAYLDALSGKGVHILTFNDYLARRVWTTGSSGRKPQGRRGS